MNSKGQIGLIVLLMMSVVGLVVLNTITEPFCTCYDDSVTNLNIVTDTWYVNTCAGEKCTVEYIECDGTILTPDEYIALELNGMCNYLYDECILAGYTPIQCGEYRDQCYTYSGDCYGLCGDLYDLCVTEGYPPLTCADWETNCQDYLCECSYQVTNATYVGTDCTYYYTYEGDYYDGGLLGNIACFLPVFIALGILVLAGGFVILK